MHVASILNNPNTDPHTFESSPSVAEQVSAAQLIVQNGVGYDTFMNKIESASPNSKRKVIVVQNVLGLPTDTPNPHLWYDPRTMPAVANVMAADLSALAAVARRLLPGEPRQVHRVAGAAARRNRRVQGQVRGNDRRDDRAGRRLPTRRRWG